MQLSVLNIVETSPTPFQAYLLSSPRIKKICNEFEFYRIRFYRLMKSTSSTVCFDYPKGNVYWYLDFQKYIQEHILVKEEFVEDWNKLLFELKTQIKLEFHDLKSKLYNITPKLVVDYQCKYSLRDYQAYDLAQFLIKYKHWENRGLILSDPRTGKSRVAIAATNELLDVGDIGLIICPKSAEIGWIKELQELNNYLEDIFEITLISKISECKRISLNIDKINVRIISYDLFKKLTESQIKQLTSNRKRILLIGDEIHRLRNFKTQQSQAIFNFKDWCKSKKITLGIIGLTGTPAVKESTDVFGILSLINESKIEYHPYWNSFNLFKDYFYFCEDTSFGRIAKALKREEELNFIIQMCSIQTKQHELPMFRNYTKKYLKCEIAMDKFQQEIYDELAQHMEYGLLHREADEPIGTATPEIDCENKLVQLVRLQQVCIDPYGLVASYELISPKLKWILSFKQKNNFKFIVACKKTTPLKHLMKLFESQDWKYAKILGELNFTERVNQLKIYETDKDCQVMFLQLDTGREALTLPMAQAIIFLDRDFAQGYNEQAEARITPINGAISTKYIIDLVMLNSKEQDIYDKLVIKKQSIKSINDVFTKGVSHV